MCVCACMCIVSLQSSKFSQICDEHRVFILTVNGLKRLWLRLFFCVHMCAFVHVRSHSVTLKRISSLENECEDEGS